MAKGRTRGQKRRLQRDSSGALPETEGIAEGGHTTQLHSRTLEVPMHTPDRFQAPVVELVVGGKSVGLRVFGKKRLTFSRWKEMTDGQKEEILKEIKKGTFVDEESPRFNETIPFEGRGIAVEPYGHIGNMPLYRSEDGRVFITRTKDGSIFFTQLTRKGIVVGSRGTFIETDGRQYIIVGDRFLKLRPTTKKHRGRPVIKLGGVTGFEFYLSERNGEIAAVKIG